jgi:hypothetical protein
LSTVESLRPHEGEPFRRRSGNGPSQGMSSSLKIQKAPILRKKGTQIDSQAIRNPQENLPFLFAQFRPRHVVHP